MMEFSLAYEPSIRVCFFDLFSPYLEGVVVDGSTTVGDFNLLSKIINPLLSHPLCSEAAVPTRLTAVINSLAFAK
jgi:hypothetical protein